MHTDCWPLMFSVLSYRSSTIPAHGHRSPSPGCRFSRPSSRTPKNGGYSRQRFYPDSPIRWTRSSRLLYVASRLFNALRDLQPSPDVAVCSSFDQHLPHVSQDSLSSAIVSFACQTSHMHLKPRDCTRTRYITPRIHMPPTRCTEFITFLSWSCPCLHNVSVLLQARKFQRQRTSHCSRRIKSCHSVDALPGFIHVTILLFSDRHISVSSCFAIPFAKCFGHTVGRIE